MTFRAPHSLRPEHEIRHWWMEARREIKGLKGVAPIFVMADCNAQVASDEGGVVGSLAGSVEDVAGSLLVELCLEAGLALANTFPCAQFRDHLQLTWRDRCLDYIALPVPLLVGSEVHQVDIDLCNPHDDHQALCVNVKVPCRKAVKLPKARRTRARTRIVRSPGWGCNVHKHAEHIFRAAQLSQQAQAKAKPLKPFVSEDTWKLIVFKRGQLAKKKRCMTELRRAILCGCFRAWAGVAGNSFQLRRSSASPCRIIAWHVKLTTAWFGISWATSRVGGLLAKDKSQYIEGLVDEARRAAGNGNTKALWHALRFFRKGAQAKKMFRALPFLLDENGEVAADTDAQTALKARHFGSMEAAKPCDARQAAACQLEPVQQFGDTFSLRELPTLYQMEQAIAKLPRSKAAGPSGVRNEYWLQDSAASARLWLPITLKTHVRLSEPARLATGILHCLYKGKGMMSQLSNWRSIFLMEGIGGASRKMLRGPLVKHLEMHSSPMMQGCKKGSCSAALTHFALTWLKVHRAKKHCAGLVFLALRSAFYRVLRGRLLGSRWTDAAICDVLAQMKVDPALFQDILDWSHGPSLLSGVTNHVARAVRSLFRFSAFLIPQEGSMHVSRSGSRPGDSIADVLFSLVMADAMGAIESELRRDFPDMYGELELCPSHPVWADDACFPFWTSSADNVAAVATHVARTVHCECSRRALEPNYGPEKTECLLVRGGPGSRQARMRMFAGVGCLEFEAHGVNAECKSPPSTHILAR